MLYVICYIYIIYIYILFRVRHDLVCLNYYSATFTLLFLNGLGKKGVTSILRGRPGFNQQVTNNLIFSGISPEKISPGKIS